MKELLRQVKQYKKKDELPMLFAQSRAHRLLQAKRFYRSIWSDDVIRTITDWRYHITSHRSYPVSTERYIPLPTEPNP